jgi:hypothetical protein
MDELSIFASDVHVRVCAPQPELLASLRALWRGCASPLVAPVRQACIEIEARPAGFELTLSGLAADDGTPQPPVTRLAESQEDVTPLAEALLYRVLHAARPSSVLLHAACMERDGAALLLLGPSGAGKSSFALAALERGYRYFSDELTISDGRRVWGVPRAIQFEAVAPSAALPARLASTDRALYRVRLSAPDAADASVPVRVPSDAELAAQPALASRAQIVRLVHGALGEAERCEPLSALDALVELHEAAFRPPHVDLGALAGRERGYRLTWRDPRPALDLLEAALRGRATTSR